MGDRVARPPPAPSPLPAPAHAPRAGMGAQQELAVLDAETWLEVSSSATTNGGGWITRDAGTPFVRLAARRRCDHELRLALRA